MRTSFALIGAVALAGTGLVAAGNPQQPASAPAQAAAASQPKAGAQPAASQPKFTASTPEEKAVMAAIGVFSKTYSEGDHATLASYFTDDAVIVDPEGNETRGKAAIGEMYGASFQENPGLKLESEVAEVRFITPDVARVEGQTRLSSAGGDATEFTRFSSLLVRKDGKWRAAELREYTAPAEDVSSYERLRDLEWMVGHWVDESETNKVEATVRWADNQSYLIRTYTVEIQGEKSSSGTMFIGWDPAVRPDQVVGLRLGGGPWRGPLDPHRRESVGRQGPGRAPRRAADLGDPGPHDHQQGLGEDQFDRPDHRRPGRA